LSIPLRREDEIILPGLAIGEVLCFVARSSPQRSQAIGEVEFRVFAGENAEVQLPITAGKPSEYGLVLGTLRLDPSLRDLGEEAAGLSLRFRGVLDDQGRTVFSYSVPGITLAEMLADMTEDGVHHWSTGDLPAGRYDVQLVPFGYVQGFVVTQGATTHVEIIMPPVSRKRFWFVDGDHGRPVDVNVAQVYSVSDVMGHLAYTRLGHKQGEDSTYQMVSPAGTFSIDIRDNEYGSFRLPLEFADNAAEVAIPITITRTLRLNTVSQGEAVRLPTEFWLGVRFLRGGEEVAILRKKFRGVRFSSRDSNVETRAPGHNEVEFTISGRGEVTIAFPAGAGFITPDSLVVDEWSLTDGQMRDVDVEIRSLR